jgi:hypothetical protein
LQFCLYSFRFTFAARQPIHFPPAAANLFRGEFGKILHAQPEAYHRIFAPKATSGPSGLADRPRPFVLRARHLDGVTVAAGAPFHFDLNFFDVRPGATANLPAAFQQFAWADLSDVSSQLQAIELDPLPDPVERVVVHFLTPTELKAGARVVDLPDFAILAARIRDRISTLRALYDEGPLDLDFRAFAERAARIRLPRCRIQQVERERRSGSTGQVHPLGGFVGAAEYEGDLGEFVPYLDAAAFTGVGRQTVWGKGEIAVSRGPQPLPEEC